MFHSARIKLTAWYLLIIMSISIAFSVVIYRVLTRELERFSRRVFLNQQLHFDTLLPPSDVLELPGPLPHPDFVNDAKHRLIVSLVMINGSIVVIAGLLGYFLAGQTLFPIQKMVDEQNRFISDASHELRTPLTSLKIAMEVALRDKNLSLAEAKKILGDNITDVNKLQSLSDGLLQLAQYQKPNGNIAFAKVSLVDIVEAAVRQTEIMAKEKAITVKTVIKPASFTGNKFGITDLVVILLDNAIKYSPKHAEITLRTRKIDGWVELAVADDGIGIAAHDLPHIFDRFYRADRARSASVSHGYGLGLAIAKKIADIHHGTIHVASKPNKGSTFTVRIPVRRPMDTG